MASDEQLAASLYPTMNQGETGEAQAPATRSNEQLAGEIYGTHFLDEGEKGDVEAHYGRWDDDFDADDVVSSGQELMDIYPQGSYDAQEATTYASLCQQQGINNRTARRLFEATEAGKITQSNFGTMMSAAGLTSDQARVLWNRYGQALPER